MRKCLSSRLLLFCLIFGLSGAAPALDVRTFNKLAKDTIRQVNMGVVGDIDALIAVQETLMALGVEGSVKYTQENRSESKPLLIVIQNAEKMRNLKLNEIEKQWHEGEFLRNKGVNMDELNHFGAMNSLMDTIIHPATSYLLLKEYKQTGDASLLARVKGELVEVLEHVKHVNDDSVQANAE